MYDLYAIFKQAHPPSGIEHCLVCNFYSTNENNLVVAGTSLVRVYRLVQDEVSYIFLFHRTRASTEYTLHQQCVVSNITKKLLCF